MPKGEEISKAAFLIWELAHPCKTKSWTNTSWKDLSRDWDGKCLETWQGLISVKFALMVIVLIYFCCKKQTVKVIHAPDNSQKRKGKIHTGVEGRSQSIYANLISHIHKRQNQLKQKQEHATGNRQPCLEGGRGGGSCLVKSGKTKDLIAAYKHIGGRHQGRKTAVMLKDSTCTRTKGYEQVMNTFLNVIMVHGAYNTKGFALVTRTPHWL